MGNPNLPPVPIERPKLEGRSLAIAALGAIGFEIEQGPNAHPPEKLQPKQEQQPSIEPE